MSRDEALRKLRAQADRLRASGVRALWLFGSTARDAAGLASDVDLILDVDDPAFSLIELVRLRRELSDVLGVPADAMTRDSLHPRLRERIEASAERVF